MLSIGGSANTVKTQPHVCGAGVIPTRSGAVSIESTRRNTSVSLNLVEIIQELNGQRLPGSDYRLRLLVLPERIRNVPKFCDQQHSIPPLKVHPVPHYLDERR